MGGREAEPSEKCTPDSQAFTDKDAAKADLESSFETGRVDEKKPSRELTGTLQ